jgi:hypothetical protein
MSGVMKEGKMVLDTLIEIPLQTGQDDQDFQGPLCQH